MKFLSKWMTMTSLTSKLPTLLDISWSTSYLSKRLAYKFTEETIMHIVCLVFNRWSESSECNLQAETYYVARLASKVDGEDVVIEKDNHYLAILKLKIVSKLIGLILGTEENFVPGMNQLVSIDDFTLTDKAVMNYGDIIYYYE